MDVTPQQLEVLEPELYPKQMEFFDAVVKKKEEGVRIFILGGGAQSGKTIVNVEVCTGLILEKMARTIGGQKPGIAWLVAPTFPLLDRLEQTFRERVPERWLRDWKAQKREWRLPTGDRIKLRSAKNPQDLRGDDCFLVAYDELSRGEEDSFLNCQTRLVANSGIFIGTTTPCNAESPWLTEEYFDHCNDSTYHWGHQRLEDNLGVELSDIARLRKRFPAQYGEEELDGRFLRSRIGLVYDNFNGRKGGHIVEDYTPVESDTIVAAIDQGSNHPFVYLRAALHAEGGMTIFSELFMEKAAPSDIVAAVKRDPIEARVKRRWADPSGAVTRNEFHKAGLPTLAAKNDVDEGIRATYALIQAKSLHITRACHDTIREFGTYRWKKDTSNARARTPVKWNDDGMDCSRYIGLSENVRMRSQVISVSNPESVRGKPEGKPYLDLELYKKTGKFYIAGVPKPKQPAEEKTLWVPGGRPWQLS